MNINALQISAVFTVISHILAELFDKFGKYILLHFKFTSLYLLIIMQMLTNQSCKKAAGTRISPLRKVYHMCGQ